MKRFTLVLLVIACLPPLGFLGLWTLAAYRSPRTADLLLDADALIADGVSSVRASLRLFNRFNGVVQSPHGRAEFTVEGGTPRIKLVRAAGGNGVLLIALPDLQRLDPEAVQVVASFEDPSGVRQEVRRWLTVLPALADRDQDGFPDAAELTSTEDQVNFLRWFTAIAEAQFYQPSEKWREEERDCAGLVRFAYKEALKRHDSRWLATMPYLKDPVIPDVKRFQYPDIPLLGTAIFRVAEGSFQTEDVRQARFSPWASSQALQRHNTAYVGRNPAGLQKGDLLFFLNIENPRLPYHVMILLGDDRGVVEGGWEDWLVYHTGP